MLFITSVIIEAFVSATNSFGSYITPRNRWKPIDSDEFKEFLAIVLHMGVVKYPHRSFAWRKDPKYGNPWVRSLMHEHRFNQILMCWWWVDRSSMSKQDIDAQNRSNSFWSVQGFLDMMAGNCLKWYNPQYKVCIDEGVFGFKGRHKARCYNPSKPEKWHFKSYCLNCSITGSQMNFFMYVGKDEKRPEGQTANEYPVIRLLDNEKFKCMNLVLATDDWYTSIYLALKLLEWDIYLFGTC